MYAIMFLLLCRFPVALCVASSNIDALFSICCEECVMFQASLKAVQNALSVEMREGKAFLWISK